MRPWLTRFWRWLRGPRFALYRPRSGYVASVPQLGHFHRSPTPRGALTWQTEAAAEGWRQSYRPDLRGGWKVVEV